MSGIADILRQADHQARVLGNLVRALELVVVGWEQARTDPELRLHLRRLARWIGGRLQPHHDPAGLAERLGLPDALPLGPPAPSSDEGARNVDTLLLDVDASGEAFVARLVLDDLARRGSSFGASFDAALDRARRVVFRMLARSGKGLRLDAERLLADGFHLVGPQAARLYHVDGGSIATAAAVTLFARWTGRPLPPCLVVTGCLGDDGAVLPVSGIQAKVAAALRERPGLIWLVVPRDQCPARDDPRVLAVASLEELFEELFGAHHPADPGPVDVEGTVRIGLELYEKRGSFALAHDLLGEALAAIARQRAARGDPGLHRVEQLLALWRAGSSLVHLGDPGGAQELFDRARPLARELWQQGEIDPRVYFGFRGNLAVLLRDRFAFEEAEAVLVESLAQQRALRQDRREVAKTLGNLGELYTFMGRFEEAEALLGQALGALRALYPDEVPRELCYLGNLHLRRGDAALALACYEEGLQLNREVTYGRDRNEAFLRYGTVRALRRLGQPERAARQADRALALLPAQELYPRQLMLRERGLARIDLERWDTGVQDLQAAADRTFARGELAELAAGTALGELALAELARGRLDEAVALGRQFRAAGGSLWQRLTPAAGVLERALASDAPGAEQLAALLRQVLDAFPY